MTSWRRRASGAGGRRPCRTWSRVLGVLQFPCGFCWAVTRRSRWWGWRCQDPSPFRILDLGCESRKGWVVGPGGVVQRVAAWYRGGDVKGAGDGKFQNSTRTEKGACEGLLVVEAACLMKDCRLPRLVMSNRDSKTWLGAVSADSSLPAAPCSGDWSVITDRWTDTPHLASFRGIEARTHSGRGLREQCPSSRPACWQPRSCR